MTIVEPKTAAPGNPWVFRADRVGRKVEVFDLALLRMGFTLSRHP